MPGDFSACCEMKFLIFLVWGEQAYCLECRFGFIQRNEHVCCLQVHFSINYKKYMLAVGIFEVTEVTYGKKQNRFKHFFGVVTVDLKK